jgi:GH15 family glucan-1,4-alpha-glucosidase
MTTMSAVAANLAGQPSPADTGGLRMPAPIEQYALVGDLHTAALISLDGSIDWLCLPRFDSEACFAALLGDERNGHWQIAPASGVRRVRRRYLPGTLVLETEFATASGTVRLADCMPVRGTDPVLIRLVEGVTGQVDMRMTLAPRFEYGQTTPQVWRHGTATQLTGGAHALWLFSPVPVATDGGAVQARFCVAGGDRVAMAAVWRPAHRPAPRQPAASALAAQTARWWQAWVADLRCGGEWREAVTRSLITVKALSYEPTGGLLSAPTTSLPQQPTGVRNWDYRYCWIRDAAAGLDAFLATGADREAGRLLDWLDQVVAGPAAQAQPVYRVAGERRIPEMDADWLPGYHGARPVRIGNATAARTELGTFGYLLRARLAGRAAGLPGVPGPGEPADLLAFLQARWQLPDAGIWEMRAPPRHFVHSKAMVWAAADAAVTMIDRFGDPEPPGPWRRLRDQVHADVLDRGFDPERRSFTQRYGSRSLDAALLQLPLLGFLPPGDPRLTGTVEAISRDLDDSGVLVCYQAQGPADADGLPPSAVGYLPGSFWLARCLAAAGRPHQARQVFTAALGLRNDVGLLAEGYDPLRRRFAGNHPLTAAHIELINTARALSMDLPACIRPVWVMRGRSRAARLDSGHPEPAPIRAGGRWYPTPVREACSDEPSAHHAAARPGGTGPRPGPAGGACLSPHRRAAQDPGRRQAGPGAAHLPGRDQLTGELPGQQAGRRDRPPGAALRLPRRHRGARPRPGHQPR